MAWVESHQTLGRHRKTLRAASLLKTDRHKLIGHLHTLWWWALDNVPSDGSLAGLSEIEIAIGAEWPDGKATEFVAALTEAGFIDRQEGGLWLHDWHEYAGKLYDQRAINRAANATRQRQKRDRARDTNGTEMVRARDNDVTPAVTKSVQPVTVTGPTVPYLTVPNPNDSLRSSLAADDDGDDDFDPRFEGMEHAVRETTVLLLSWQSREDQADPRMFQECADLALEGYSHAELDAARRKMKRGLGGGVPFPDRLRKYLAQRSGSPPSTPSASRSARPAEPEYLEMLRKAPDLQAPWSPPTRHSLTPAVSS